jgi:UDP-N-acetylglucosamine transferase subunit ALG13
MPSVSITKEVSMDNHQLRQYLRLVENHLKEIADQLDEKWGKPTQVSPAERGKYHGKTKDELLAAYNKLKASGPHRRGSPEFGRMRELAFAIRAKSGWGRVE